MPISALRTIKPPVARRGMSYGLGDTARWPTAAPGGVLDYSIDIATDLADISDKITALAVSVAPSGAGELSVSNLQADGSIVTLWLSGGVPGRQYHCQLLVTCQSSGRVLPYLIGILINPGALAPFPLPDPPSAGFGDPVFWPGGAPNGGALDFFDAANSALLILI